MHVFFMFPARYTHLQGVPKRTSSKTEFLSWSVQIKKPPVLAKNITIFFEDFGRSNITVFIEDFIEDIERTQKGPFLYTG